LKRVKFYRLILHPKKILLGIIIRRSLVQIKELKMKRLISIILIFAHTSILFADTLTFKSGEKIEGKLVKFE